jgi:hypothetical protein
MQWAHRMGWTQRMTEVVDARRELQALGRKPTLQEIADRIGVSRERVRQVLDKIERYNRRTVPTYDEHVKCWRHWMAENFQAWLPLILRGIRDLKLSRETPKLPKPPFDRKEYMRQYREKRRQQRQQYDAEKAEAARRRSEYYREQAAERLRKEREFPPPPDPFDVTCMMRGTELYERLRLWRGLQPKFDGAAELARWNRRSTR